MREQVEERLDCCEKDVAARKYLDVTKAAIECMTNTVSEEDKEENGGKKESNSEADDDAMHLDKPAMHSTLCTRLAIVEL